MNREKLFRPIFLFVLIAALAGNVFPLGLHTFHTSLTRIDYNTKEKLVEISINLFTHDLVPTLERRAGKRIDLEKTPDIDKVIFSFLNENFILKDKKGGTKKLVWVGKEVRVDAVYLYVETASTTDLEGFSLQNTFFFDSFPEQTNLVIARYSDKKANLLFKVGDKFKEIESSKKTLEN